MILKALTLENFKGIREPVRIEFAPLTLLFGPNNAGKSTIVQALMYAREVLERNNCDTGRTALGGDVVDLGGFRNLVRGQDIDRAIRMRFELDLRPSGLPRFMSEKKAEDLGHRVSAQERLDMDWMVDERHSVGAYSREGVLGGLTNVWVEIEISHRQSTSLPSAINPVVCRYSVGAGSACYATISLPDGSDRAALTYFNFGTPPFGWGYTKGESSDFEWDLARIVRHWVKKELAERGSRAHGLKKGAGVALAGTLIGSEHLMSRQDFNALVSEIVNGEGKWGDDTPDEETGKPSKAYQRRQEMIGLALAAGGVRAQRAGEPSGEGLDLETFLTQDDDLSVANCTYPAFEPQSSRFLDHIK